MFTNDSTIPDCGACRVKRTSSIQIAARSINAVTSEAVNDWARQSRSIWVEPL